jgi:hypothetical protein
MPSIFLLQDGTKLLEMTEQSYDSEDLLQKLLANFPNVLAGDQFEGDEPKRWLLINRETAVPSDDAGVGRWSLDHLFVDQHGIPTLVEVKRSSDTRIRREVVGQMLDYAANAVAYWPAGKIRENYEKRCESTPDANQKLAEFLLQADLEPEEESTAIDSFWEEVDTNLRAGQIRLIFVSDAIPAELRRIVEFLNEQMSPAEVFAIEIKQFTGENVTSLVPIVIGQTARAAAIRARTAGNRQPLPEFRAIIDAYDSSCGERPQSLGTAPGYRQIKVPGWRNAVTYLFSRHGKSVWVELRVKLEVYPDLATVLGPFAGKTVADGRAVLRWDIEQGRLHLGRLIAEFPITDAPAIASKGMCDLISMTKPAVDGFLGRSTNK